MSDDATPPGGKGRVELRLEPETAAGRYANGTVVTRGRHEVVLDFVAALPHHRPQVVARIVLPHAQAQALAATLTRTLAGDAHGPAGTPARGDGDDPN